MNPKVWAYNEWNNTPDSFSGSGSMGIFDYLVGSITSGLLPLAIAIYFFFRVIRSGKFSRFWSHIRENHLAGDYVMGAFIIGVLALSIWIAFLVE